MSLSPQICDFCGTANLVAAKFCSSCGRLLNNNPAITEPLLKNRYRLLTPVGQGGMGSVYRAEDILFKNAPRAVKKMSLDGLRQQEFQMAISSFKQEAMLLASLIHPNLPRIYDYFQEGGYWYLVMDFIDGQTLESFLEAYGGKLLAKDVLAIGIQLCTVLGYLHSQQPPIIFRDLKPANIMVTAEGHIYLIDFGIARLFKPGQTKDTHSWGTTGYAAPEQYGSAQTDARADIFALGVILYQLLSGYDPTRTPFQFPPLRLSKQSPIALLEPLIMRMVDVARDNRPESVHYIRKEMLSINNRLENYSCDFLPKRYINSIF